MTTRYDVAILGAGPVGMALALMLARLTDDPSRIAVFGRQPAPGLAARPDPRTLALNEGSRLTLSALDAWPAHAAPIQTIHVSQAGRLGRTVIRHDDFDVPALGHVAHYASLTDALQAQIRRAGVASHDAVPADLLEQDGGDPDYPVRLPRAAQPASVVSASREEASEHAATRKATHDPSSERPIRARVVVIADGTAAAEIVRDYDQHAVLTQARASRPRPGWAWERFRQEGPLAVLPHPGGEDHYAIVWCCRPATARHLNTLGDDALSRELTAAFGDRLGTLQVHGDRHVFPLTLRARRQVVDRNVVAIGNAAQSLHPVAGQGLNLGLRDAAQLSQALAPWLAQPGEPDAARAALLRYARSRRIDRQVTGLLTDLMPRVFSTGWAGVEHVSGAALLALDLSRHLRAPLARQLLYGSRG